MHLYLLVFRSRCLEWIWVPVDGFYVLFSGLSGNRVRRGESLVANFPNPNRGMHFICLDLLWLLSSISCARLEYGFGVCGHQINKDSMEFVA